MNEKIYIGIDPGTHTGMAMWYKKAKTLEILTTDFWGCIDKIDMLRKLGIDIECIIEDPGLNKGMHWHKHNHKGSFALANDIAQKVGGNKREARLLIEYCIKEVIRYVGVKPTSSKWNDGYFKSVTGYEGRSSQHARDAAKLVYGM